MSRRRGLLAAIPFFGFGLFFVLLTAVPSLRGRPTLFWPETTGVLLEARARPFYAHSRSWGTLRGEDFEVSYRYEVGGRTFQSERLSFRRVSYGQFRRLGRPGDSVSVFYNPRSPGEAVLFPGAPRLAGGPLFFVGLILTAVAAALSVLALLRTEA